VLFGFRSAEKSVLKGVGQLVIVSSNAQKNPSERLRHLASIAGIPLLGFKGSGLELGSVCGKPFVVSAKVVEDQGKSKLLDAIAEKPKRAAKASRSKR
jgi:large subunit ribosomal protein L30e